MQKSKGKYIEVDDQRKKPAINLIFAPLPSKNKLKITELEGNGESKRLQIPINSILVADREVERCVYDDVRGQCVEKLLVLAQEMAAVGKYFGKSQRR